MKHKKGGFTLVEIIVSLALIGIIAVGIIPAFAAAMKMTVQTKELTAQSFNVQGEIENVIQDLKNALVDPVADETAIEGVAAVTKSIFGRNVTMFRLIQDYPYNENKSFLVFLSKKLAEMEVRQLLVAEGVTIEVSNETIHKVADLKKTPKPTLIGKVAQNTDPNWFTNLYRWYVSKEGDPDPVFPDDYERIDLGITAPATLDDLTNLANRYIVFTVIPVDIHGVRGNEVRSNNTIYVLGEEWRAGSFAWVDKNRDVTYAAETDVMIAKKDYYWHLLKGFNTANQFQDPDLPEEDQWLDPSNGSLYVPMRIDAPVGAINGPITVEGGDLIDWIADRSINLATDIDIRNNTDIKMESNDGSIVLYQFIDIDPLTEDAIFESDGMPKLINDGPTLETGGKIQLQTAGRGDVTLQNYSELDAGDGIILSPFGHISVYKSFINAGGSITLDSTKGATFPGDRSIVIQDSMLTLDTNTVSDRMISISTLNELDISNTVFTGNTGAASTVRFSAPDGIKLSDVEFSNSSIQFDHDTAMTGGGWSGNSTLTIPDSKRLTLGASGTKVANSGALTLGNTGSVYFIDNMASDIENPLTINLNQGDTDKEVVISTNYGRNVGYADSSGWESVSDPGAYQNLGTGQTNLKYTEVFESGFGEPSVSYNFDGNNKIQISADGIGPISAVYSLRITDRYAEGVTGSIWFRVTAPEGGSPEVHILGSSMPAFTVYFDKNGGTADAVPSQIEVGEGQVAGSLPQPPVLEGYSFIGWNTAPDGSGDEFTAATVVTGDMTIYAQYSLIPVFTVTFNKNGGLTEADPNTMLIPQGGKIGTLPAPPTQNGYLFLNWSTEATGGTLVNTETIVRGDMTVYAQWTTKKAFSSIQNGEYIIIGGKLFQKVSNNQLLARDRIQSGGNYAMNWTTARDLAAGYHSSLSTSWITGSGLAVGSVLNSLDGLRNEILNIGHDWWGAANGDYYVYYVSDSGNVSGTVPRYAYYTASCRPVITVNPTDLYVGSGTGTADDPYVLSLD